MFYSMNSSEVQVGMAVHSEAAQVTVWLGGGKVGELEPSLNTWLKACISACGVCMCARVRACGVCVYVVCACVCV